MLKLQNAFLYIYRQILILRVSRKSAREASILFLKFETFISRSTYNFVHFDGITIAKVTAGIVSVL